MSQHLVYAMVDPRQPHAIRYVGQTGNQADVRRRQHMNLSRYRRRHGQLENDCMRWINSLLAQEIEPQVQVLAEGLAYEEAVMREMDLISALYPFGLLNDPDTSKCWSGRRIGSKDSPRAIQNKIKSWEEGREPVTSRPALEACRRGQRLTAELNRRRMGYPRPDLPTLAPENRQRYLEIYKGLNREARRYSEAVEQRRYLRRVELKYPKPWLPCKHPDNMAHFRQITGQFNQPRKT